MAWLTSSPMTCRRSPTSRSSSCAARAVRAGLHDALAARRPRRCRSRVPVLIGDDERDRARSWSRPIPASPTASSRARPHGDRRRGRRGRRRRARARARATGARDRPRSAPRRCSRAAAWMRERRLELAALEVRECAKPWPEADADVCEAIDFLEYYARGAIELDARRASCSRSRASATSCATCPRGVAAVIAPWNFPLAIPCGMTAGGARHRQRGRAQARRAVARRARCSVVQALRAGGVPARRRSRCCPARATSARRWSAIPSVHDDRVHRLAAGRPGDHPRRRRDRARPAPPQAVVAELGGKNCVIVDADADLDEAVPGDRRPRRSSTRARSARRPRACWSTRRSPTS